MMDRMIPRMLSALVVVAFLAAPLMATDQHSGSVIAAGNGKITMLDMDGKSQKTFDVATDAKITKDGKESKLEFLLNGDSVKVTTEQRGNQTWATLIEARSPY